MYYLQVSALVLLGISGQLAAGVALASRAEGAELPLPIVPMVYKGYDGVSENGTVQEIFEKLGAKAPSLDNSAKDVAHLPQPQSKGRIECNPAGAPGDIFRTKTGIIHLKGLKGGCGVLMRAPALE